MSNHPVGVTFIRYEWADGARVDLDPDVVGKEFERITESGLLLTKEEVIEVSRPNDAPLHDYFEWRDDVAGELWRGEQAKYLIRSVVRVPIRNDTEEELPPVRAFVSVLNDPELGEGFEPIGRSRGVQAPRHYAPIPRVMSDHDLRDQYRRKAFDALCSWRDRYADIEEFVGIFERIDALRAQQQ
jgi:hypothetical protein